MKRKVMKRKVITQRKGQLFTKQQKGKWIILALILLAVSFIIFWVIKLLKSRCPSGSKFYKSQNKCIKNCKSGYKYNKYWKCIKTCPSDESLFGTKCLACDPKFTDPMGNPYIRHSICTGAVSGEATCGPNCNLRDPLAPTWNQLTKDEHDLILASGYTENMLWVGGGSQEIDCGDDGTSEHLTCKCSGSDDKYSLCENASIDGKMAVCYDETKAFCTNLGVTGGRNFLIECDPPCKVSLPGGGEKVTGCCHKGQICCGGTDENICCDIHAGAVCSKRRLLPPRLDVSNRYMLCEPPHLV